MTDEQQVQFGEFVTKYKGKIFSIKQRKVVYPDGHFEFHEYCQRFNSVTVLAFDDKNNLILTREFREARNKYVWFLPTGKIDKGEDPEESAIREMREEIGLRPQTIKLLFKRPASSSYFLWDTYVFVAKDLKVDPLQPEEFFEIETVPTPMEKAVSMALSGEIENVYLSYNILRFDYMARTKEFKW
ncbi:MAG: NUDIX hydrolase [bacterium]